MSVIIQFTPEILIPPEPPPSNRFVDLRYSKDGGRNWSDWRKLSLGGTGDFIKRVQARRLGRGLQWIFDIRVTDPVRADLMAGSFLPEPTDS